MALASWSADEPSVSCLSLFLLDDFCPHYGLISLLSCIPGSVGREAWHGQFCLVEGQMLLRAAKNSWVSFPGMQISYLETVCSFWNLPLQLCPGGPGQWRVYFSPLLRHGASEDGARYSTKYEAFPLWLVWTSTTPCSLWTEGLFACFFPEASLLASGSLYTVLSWRLNGRPLQLSV